MRFTNSRQEELYLDDDAVTPTDKVRIEVATLSLALNTQSEILQNHLRSNSALEPSNSCPEEYEFHRSSNSFPHYLFCGVATVIAFGLGIVFNACLTTNALHEISSSEIGAIASPIPKTPGRAVTPTTTPIDEKNSTKSDYHVEKFRLWKNNTGEYTTKALLISGDARNVHLLKQETSNVVTVPMTKLSTLDRTYAWQSLFGKFDEKSASSILINNGYHLTFDSEMHVIAITVNETTRQSEQVFGLIGTNFPFLRKLKIESPHKIETDFKLLASLVQLDELSLCTTLNPRYMEALSASLSKTIVADSGRPIEQRFNNTAY